MLDPTPEEYKLWRAFALKQVKRQNKKFALDHLSLGFEAYADQAIEKLILEDKVPDNWEAWLTTAIKHLSLDHARRNREILFRDDPHLAEKHEKADFLALQMMKGFQLSLASEIVREEHLSEVLATLSEKDQKIIELTMQGFGTDEIADELGYATSKVVANRLKIIRTKLKEAFGENGELFF